jgi:hypothetical protein
MVKVPAHLSSTGVDKWREFGIDSCIAPIGRPGQLLIRSSHTAHRIEVDRPAWSLVFTTRPFRPWGFFTRAGWRRFIPGQDSPICEDIESPEPAVELDTMNFTGSYDGKAPRP